jgi:hypothetical protein
MKRLSRAMIITGSLYDSFGEVEKSGQILVNGPARFPH